MSKLVEECMLGRYKGRPPENSVLCTTRAHIDILFPLIALGYAIIFVLCDLSPFILWIYHVIV